MGGNTSRGEGKKDLQVGHKIIQRGDHDSSTSKGREKREWHSGDSIVQRKGGAS